MQDTHAKLVLSERWEKETDNKHIMIHEFMDSWIHDESSQVQSIIEYLKRRDFVDDEMPPDYGCTYAILTYFKSVL